MTHFQVGLLHQQTSYETLQLIYFLSGFAAGINGVRGNGMTPVIDEVYWRLLRWLSQGGKSRCLNIQWRRQPD